MIDKGEKDMKKKKQLWCSAEAKTARLVYYGLCKTLKKWKLLHSIIISVTKKKSMWQNRLPKSSVSKPLA